MAEYDQINLSFDGITPTTTLGGSLPHVILLHGMKMTKESWADLRRPIANGTGRTVFAYDARNHGDSGWTENYHYDAMVNDLLVLKKTLRSPKSVLIGHSMGGKTAMKLALEKPEMIEKLIVEDFTPTQQPSFEKRVQRFEIFQLQKKVLEEIPPEIKTVEEAQKFVASFMRDKFSQESRIGKMGQLDPSSMPIIQVEDGKFQWKFNFPIIERGLLQSGMHSQLDGLYEGPALFIYGTLSPYNIIKDKDFILKLFPNATFKPIDGATHYVHTEYPKEFVQEVVDFIKSG